MASIEIKILVDGIEYEFVPKVSAPDVALNGNADVASQNAMQTPPDQAPVDQSSASN